MSPPVPQLRALAIVLSRCRMARFGVLGPDHESLPVPVFRLDGLRIVRMLAPSRVDPDTGRLHLSPPSYLVEQRADTGDFAEARAVVPKTFGQENDPTDDLGPIVRPADFEDRLARLCASLDEILPAFAAGPALHDTAPPEKRRAVRDAFLALAEAPLVPYYRSLGQAFFAFLDKGANKEPAAR